MTIARKLWLGFGVLILIFVLAGLIIFFSQRAVNNALDQIVRVEEPTRAASYEMEINATEIARDVLDYLETGDARYRDQFESNREDFERFKDSYDALVDTERGERQGDRTEVLFEEYAALGEDLTSGEPSGGSGGAIGSDERRFLELQAELDAVFDEEVQPWTRRQLGESEDAAEDAIRGVYATLAVLLLGGLLAGVLAATLINRGIIGSVRALREGAERIGRGDLDHRLELDTTDELGTVAAAFNAMLDRRREDDAALQESEERFRGLSDASFEGIAIIEDGKIVETNTAFVRMYGYEPSEVVGMSATDFVAPEFREAALGQISSGSEESYESVGIKKDGTAFDVEARGRMSSYRNRTVRITALRDITERKEAEEELRNSEARIRAIVETTPDAIITMTKDGTVRSFNPGAERIFGYAAEEVVGEPLRMLMPERFRGAHEEGFRRYLGGGEAHVIGKGAVELAGLRKDGTEFPLDLSLGEMREDDDILFTGIVRDITERKRAELAVRQNEERFRQLFDQSVDALFVHDASGRIVDCNAEACRSLGYSREELLSLRIKDLATNQISEEEKRSATTPTLWQRALSGEPGKVAGIHRGEHRRKDGTTFPVEVYVGSVDYGGERMIFASSRDVTERKRAEEELRESEERYRLVAQATNEAIWDHDLTTNGQVWDGALKTMFGYDPEEVGADAGWWEERIHPEDKERVLSSTEAALRNGGETWSVEYRFRRADGAYVTVVDRAFLVRDAEGRPVRMLGSMMDVTERRRAEERLRSSEAELRAVFSAMDDVILVLDAEGYYLKIAPTNPSLLYRPSEELVGKTLHETFPAEQADAFLGHIRRALEERRPVNTEYELTVDGREIWFAGTVSPMEEDRVVYVARDVTERKRAEEELRESEERYRLVAQATNEAIWDSDILTDRQTWNGAVEAMFGYPAGQETDGAWWEDHIHPDDRGRVLSGINDILDNGGEMWSDEYRFRRADGAHVTVVDRAYLVRDTEGRPVRMIGSMMDVTERKRTEEEIRELNESLERRVEERTVELRESEERYSLVVEGSNDGIFDWDIVEDTLYWNDRLFEMLGLSRSIFTPTIDSFLELVRPEDREKVSEHLTTHLERGEEFEVEFGVRHTSGEYRTCIGRGKAQRDENGRPFRMAGTLTDIAERKRAEEALRLLAEASAELSSSLDYRATLASVARLAVPRLADWCAVDVLKEDGSLDRIAVVHQDPHKVELAHELQERYPSDPGAPGGIHNVLRTARPEFYPEIPEEMLEAAARDEEHLRIMREIGFSSAIIVPITARSRTLGTITLVAAESGRRYGEADLRLAEDLARRSASAVDNAILFEEAQKELVERKRAEEEIRRLNESLENRVEERTAQLQNAIFELERAGENLRRAKEEAESANRAKSEFLANMSHEIRTPMNGVIGMTELLLDTPLSDEQREYADTIRLSGEGLLAIINDILDFSKIEAGEMRLETIDFDLRMAVEDVVALFAERAHEKGLELASLVDYDVPTALEGDPGRIRQILTNLVGNAIKFTEEGEVVLHAELAEEHPERATVRISVRDTGIGMIEEQQARVFESFSQADTSTTRRFGGTGLGLTISRQLVELMDGEIGVESEPGVGSTFFFTLPLKKQPGGAPRAPGPLVDLRDLRVLIVDDNATNRQILHKQLTSWGMESGEAGDGFAALEKLRSTTREGLPYDLAILDMQMPGMDGMQLARQISGDRTISPPRLVLLTSVGQRGEGDEARQAGIEAYLTKPVRQSELYDAIATVMGTPQRSRVERSTLVTLHTLREMHTDSRVRLLLAEDNPVNQKVAARTLERLGYRVDVAQNGLEALEALARNRYAAVLMDVQMPEMDGYEATAEIRRREREAALAGGEEDRPLPIIAMTANALQGDREKALASGMDDYLAKPVKQEDLEETLDRWVPKEAAGEGGVPPEGVPEAPASRAAGEGHAIDPDVLEGLRELGDPELLVELAGLFLDDTASRLAALKEAVRDDDAPGVERVAHTLKGSSGNIGATRMAAICADLQEAGASGDLARAPGLLERLEEEFGRVRPALEAEIEKGS